MNKNENYDIRDVENLMMRIVSLKGKNDSNKSLNFCKNIMMKNVRKIHFEIIREYNEMKEKSGERNYVRFLLYVFNFYSFLFLIIIIFYFLVLVT
jgi:hypothetical protein